MAEEVQNKLPSSTPNSKPKSSQSKRIPPAPFSFKSKSNSNLKSQAKFDSNNDLTSPPSSPSSLQRISVPTTINKQAEEKQKINTTSPNSPNLFSCNYCKQKYEPYSLCWCSNNNCQNRICVGCRNHPLMNRCTQDNCCFVFPNRDNVVSIFETHHHRLLRLDFNISLNTNLLTLFTMLYGSKGVEMLKNSDPFGFIPISNVPSQSQNQNQNQNQNGSFATEIKLSEHDLSTKTLNDFFSLTFKVFTNLVPLSRNIDPRISVLLDLKFESRGDQRFSRSSLLWTSENTLFGTFFHNISPLVPMQNFVFKFVTNDPISGHQQRLDCDLTGFANLPVFHLVSTRIVFSIVSHFIPVSPLSPCSCDHHHDPEENEITEAFRELEGQNETLSQEIESTIIQLNKIVSSISNTTNQEQNQKLLPTLSSELKQLSQSLQTTFSSCSI